MQFALGKVGVPIMSFGAIKIAILSETFFVHAPLTLIEHKERRLSPQHKLPKKGGYPWDSIPGPLAPRVDVHLGHATWVSLPGQRDLQIL